MTVWRRLILLAALSLGTAARANSIDVEGAASGFAVSLVAPGGGFGVGRSFGTYVWFKVFLLENVGIHLKGGASWYSALGFTPVDAARTSGPVVFPTGEGLLGGTYRLPLHRQVLWIDFDASVGATGTLLGLSQSRDKLVRIPLGFMATGMLAATLYVRLERHIAFIVSLQGQIFGTSTPTAGSCTVGDLSALGTAVRTGATLRNVATSANCNKTAFADLTSETIEQARTLLELQRNLVSGTFGIVLGFAVF